MSDRAQPQFDVEAPLSIDDAYDVFEAMYKACNRWRNIGGAFRVPDSTLSCIALEEDSAEDRLYRVIKAWLENGGGTSACTWALVAETLRKITVGRDDIAREVEKKYLKQMPRATQTMRAPETPSLSGSSHDPVPVLPQPLLSAQPQPQATETTRAPEMPSLSGSSHDPVPVSPQPLQSEASVHVSPQPQPQATETTRAPEIPSLSGSSHVPVPVSPQPSQSEASVHVSSQPQPQATETMRAPEMLSLSGGSHDPVPVLPQSSQSEASVHVSPQPQPQPQATETMSVRGHEGGNEKKLSLWDLHSLLFLLASVATKWRAIGVGLHFPEHMLTNIGQKLVCIVGGPCQCLREVLAQWLRRDEPLQATTGALARVLRLSSVSEGELANELENTFSPADCAPPVVDEQVRSRIRLLKDCFEWLRNGTLERLEQKTISVKVLCTKVSLLNCLAVDESIVMFLDSKMVLLSASPNIDHVFFYLNHFWSYLSYHLLEHLIGEFSLDDLEKRMKEFKGEIEIFKIETPLRVFATIEGIVKPRVPEGFEKLTSHHEFSRDCSLKQIDTVRSELDNKYKFEKCALILYNILANCIKIVWLIPKSASQHVIKMTSTIKKETFREIMLTKLELNGKPIYVDDLTSKTQQKSVGKLLPVTSLSEGPSPKLKIVAKEESSVSSVSLTSPGVMKKKYPRESLHSLSKPLHLETHPSQEYWELLGESLSKADTTETVFKEQLSVSSVSLTSPGVMKKTHPKKSLAESPGSTLLAKPDIHRTHLSELKSVISEKGFQETWVVYDEKHHHKKTSRIREAHVYLLSQDDGGHYRTSVMHWEEDALGYVQRHNEADISVVVECSPYFSSLSIDDLQNQLLSMLFQLQCSTIRVYMKKFRRELYSLHDFEMQEALSSMEGRDVAAVEVATVDNLGDDQFRVLIKVLFADMVFRIFSPLYSLEFKTIRVLQGKRRKLEEIGYVFQETLSNFSVVLHEADAEACLLMMSPLYQLKSSTLSVQRSQESTDSGDWILPHLGFRHRIHSSERGTLYGDSIGKAVGDILRLSTGLHSISLYNNSIGAEGARAIANGLKYCTSLKTLNLFNNSIGAEGARAIGDGLKYCISLQSLNLAYNSIGAEGARVIGDGLKYCTSLKTLNLDKSNIGDEGARAIADGMKCCTTLERLSLNRNALTDETVEVFCELILTHKSLTYLGLSWNEFTGTGKTRLHQANEERKKQTGFTHLSLHLY